MAKKIDLKVAETDNKVEKCPVSGLEEIPVQIREIDKKIDELSTAREAMRTLIMNHVSPLMKENVTKGLLYKTYLILSKDDNPAQVIYKNMFSKLDITNEKVMREVMGAYFNEFFSIETTQMMKKNADMGRLKTILGDKYDDFFEDKSVVSFAKDFMEKRATLHPKLTKEIKAQLDGWTKEYQAKPDLRVK
jgi:hypothetical protein